jgi:FAD/FMN-containing dehydrogenase
VLLSFDDLASASAAATAALQNVVTPIAIDLLNPLFGAPHGLRGYNLAMLFGGNQAVIDRSLKIAATLGKVRALSAEEESKFWGFVRNATPTHMEKFADGAVVRVTTPLSEVKDALASAEHPAMVHAGNGVVRQWFTRPDAAGKWLGASVGKGWKGVVEAAGDGAKGKLELWPGSGGDFAIMKQIKHMFDPEGLLNSGRLYGRI